ncbi:hypothetical protein N7505_007738 [Penicillium chrysogenum]|mgnify:FL=1|jgi:hypothetical protein|uniref:Uncharacterized protein n=1 Tax=Penicillium chrysogenum TaxID=5076 RepID=A0ABQ8WEG5_PENCH|nr:hypothetical protein N7505_007738 [Penicillium chrysogenum]
MPFKFERRLAVLEAEKLGWKLGYVQGKLIKCDLSGDEVDSWQYVEFDRENGKGAFEECVTALRAGK